MSKRNENGFPAGWAAAAEDGSYEAALAALDEIVAFLEDGRRPLDDMVAAYEVGVRISQRCEQLLASAELRVSHIAVEDAPRRIGWNEQPAEGEPESPGRASQGPDEAPF